PWVHALVIERSDANHPRRRPARRRIVGDLELELERMPGNELRLGDEAGARCAEIPQHAGPLGSVRLTNLYRKTEGITRRAAPLGSYSLIPRNLYQHDHTPAARYRKNRYDGKRQSFDGAAIGNGQ